MAKITRGSRPKSKLTAAKPAQKSRSRPAAKSGRAPAAKTSLKAKSRASKSKASKSPASKPWTPAEVHEAFSRFRKANPEPKGELEHLNPYTLLVAVVLSAQATDAGVNKATRALFAVADTPQKMLALGEEKVRDYIKTVGLYRNKAKNVIALSEKLIAEFGGEVPRTRAEIESLPGAGRKTANVVLNMAFGEHTMAVDTHVFRLGNRTGLAPGNTPLEVFNAVCHRMGIETGVDVFKLMDVAEDLVVPMLDTPIRIDRDALILGYAGVYSSFLLFAKRASARYKVPSSDILIEMGRMKAVGGQEDLIEDVALNLARQRGVGSNI